MAIGASGLVLAAIVVLLVTVVFPGGGAANREVVPAPVPSGPPDVQPAVLSLANPTDIAGVVAYDTTGWPETSNNGPPAQALRHGHVKGPVTYSVTPPVGGDHNDVWSNCGVYDQPIPNERAVHDLEHGAVWITYQPSLPAAQVAALRDFAGRQSEMAGSRYVVMSPYPALSSPIVISSWGYQLRVASPTDPRLQSFVNTFRSSRTYSPEYGGECTGGVGTPLQV